jgi:hypothetical protein
MTTIWEVKTGLYLEDEPQFFRLQKTAITYARKYIQQHIKSVFLAVDKDAVIPKALRMSWQTKLRSPNWGTAVTMWNVLQANYGAHQYSLAIIERTLR